MVSREHGGSKRKDHAQDGETLIAIGDQRPAILPWSLNFGWRPSFRVVSRAPCPRPAAGLLLDDLVEHDLSGKPVSTFPDHALAHDRLPEIESPPFKRKIMRKRAPSGAREL
jgi:hypothetical protein